MADNPVPWFEIYVQDMERARRFYEGVFEVTLERLPAEGIEMWAFPMVAKGPGAAGALVRMEGVEPGGGGTLVYFRCDDCSIEEGRAAASGGRVLRPKTPIGEWGFMSLVADTEGNVVGLHSNR
ncbi:MAG: VOC family protein [Acidobacteriota bacterium]|jgi:predicted enzyme related to lactoylglutathione lyase|nr:MAG: lactoylglutathione lyase [Acidobacteriota bacterium]